MAEAIEALIQGQRTYGPAGIWGRVVARGNERIEYGRLNAHISSSPPIATEEWPSDTLTYSIPGTPFVGLRIQTTGPTLDNWDRFWFDLLWQAVLVWLPSTGAPLAAANHFTMPSNPVFGEGLLVSYYPNAVAGQTLPTIQMLISVIRIVQTTVSRFGARVLVFYIADNQHVHGLGSIQFAPRSRNHTDEDMRTGGNITLSNNISAANSTSGDDNPSGGTSQA
ncbi:MAG: hypothetical protein Q9181_003539 [Wetmoreana brouardii]